jgi:hypothetical protein
MYLETNPLVPDSKQEEEGHPATLLRGLSIRFVIKAVRKHFSYLTMKIQNAQYNEIVVCIK